jgi:hypothetical protein
MAKPIKKIILGDDGANTLIGTDDAEIIFGLGNNDTISAWAGNDQDHHSRARLHSAVQIDHILIGQSDAARRNRMSDPSWLVCAMDAIQRVLAIGIKVERACTHWIACAAFDIVRKRAQPPLLTFGGRPSRPLFFAADRGHAGPCLSVLANDRAVANGFTLGKNIVDVAASWRKLLRSWRIPKAPMLCGGGGKSIARSRPISPRLSRAGHETWCKL